MNRHPLTSFRSLSILVLGSLGACTGGSNGPDCTQATLIIAKNKELVHRSGADSVHYHEGDTVNTDYVNGLLILNGVPLWKVAPERMRSVESLSQLYGAIPFVQEYLARSNAPDEITKWNEAYRAMVRARRTAIDSAYVVFDGVRAQGLGFDEAAQRALSGLATNSRLVASASVLPERFPDRPSHSRLVLVHWLGSYEEHYEFPRPPRPRILQPGDTMSLEAACALVHTMQLCLQEASGVAGRVELNNGNINILGENLTLLRRHQGQ